VHIHSLPQTALHSARREALAGFGDDRVLLERFITRPRHIEVRYTAVHCGTLRYFSTAVQTLVACVMHVFLRRGCCWLLGQRRMKALMP
jgi:hypothetical protein